MQQSGREGLLPPRPPDSGTCSDRDSFLDNCKGLAILFTLFIHGNTVAFVLVGPQLLDTFTGRVFVGFVSSISFVAMPSFCFISGLLSPNSLQRKHVARCIKYFVAYLIWHSFSVLTTTAANAPTDLSSGHHAPIIQFWSAVGVEWYLLCLVLWRLLFLPVFSLLPWPITVSIGVAVFMMSTDASLNTQAASTFGFLPFFVAGCSLRGRLREAQAWTRGRARGPALAAWAAAVAAMAAQGREWVMFPQRVMGCVYGGMDGAGMAAQDSVRAMLNATHPFVPPPTSDWCATSPWIAGMAAFYPVALALIFVFGALIPEHRVVVVTRSGFNSLYIYLVHFILVMVPGFMLGISAVAEGKFFPPLPTTFVTLLVVLCTWVALSGEWVKCLCGVCVEPPVESCLLGKEDMAGNAATVATA